MSWEESLCEGFKANGIRLICHVPDMALARLIQLVEQDSGFTVVPLTREEEGIGILSGGYLGGIRGALLLQSTGLGNSLNALTSLSIAQQIPFLMIVNPRGDLGEWNAFQVPMGRVLEPMLELLTLQHGTLRREEEVRPTLDRACCSAFSSNLPVALILSPELTEGQPA